VCVNCHIADVVLNVYGGRVLEDFIEDIYKKSKIITAVKKMQENCLSRKYRIMLEQWSKLVEPITELCKETTRIDENLGVEIWTKFQQIKENIEKSRYVKVVDLLENVCPYLYSAVSLLGEIDVSEGDYRFFSTKSGFLNIQLLKYDSILYSDNDPVWNNYILAKALFVPTMKHFFVMGCGLGYLPWQMFEASNESIDIYILDIDSTMIDFARSYGTLSYIPSNRLHIIVRNNVTEAVSQSMEIIDELDEDEFVFYVEEYIYGYLNENDRSIIDTLDSSIQTRLDFGVLAEQNYYRNHLAVKKTIGDIVWEKYSRQWIVVGGGPSFDDNIEYLKEQKGKKTIIAASTILKRMLSNDIEPDIIAVIDPQSRTYGHMEGVDNHNPVMILSECACWKFGALYGGDKYLALTAGSFYSMHEKDSYGVMRIQGTVTAFAIEIASFAGADTIELIGVDLSYPNGDSHAKGTMDSKKINCDRLKKVPSVDGGQVHTSTLFSMYLKDIEELISENSQIEFYNLSKHGALIKGCELVDRSLLGGIGKID